MHIKPLTLALACLFATPVAYAVGVANEAQFESIDVSGQRAGGQALPADLPNTTATKTEKQLAAQNLVNPEDVLRYVPNTTIRKRYIGDRNALVGGRNFGTLQPQRALVYVDDYLISNFLGRFDAPRWNMVTPEAIERVDVLYGPYSALYPGNSIGTTVVVKEKAPDKLEGSARLSLYTQDFSAYGYSEDFNGGQLSAYLGNRFDSGLWAAVTLNHQDSTSHPMQYFTRPVTPGTAGTPVTGIRYDRDPVNAPRAVFGANSGAIDHTIQDTAKLKLGYEIAPGVELTGLVGLWENDTVNRNRTFLRDAVTGAPVWGGTVTDGVNTFNLGTNAFVPSERFERHRQLGATLKTHYKTGWNGSVVVTDYTILDDANRVASASEPASLAGGAGTVTRRDGTGWSTFEIQAHYKPVAGDFGDGKHSLTFGFHRNVYQLENVVNNASDWRNNETTRNQAFFGETENMALYAQDVWQFAENWKLTAGLRYERFEAMDGEQIRDVGGSCTPGTGVGFTATCSTVGAQTFRTLDYDSRKLSAASPKLSLAWSARDDLLLRASYGRGVRFPNVEELYNGTVTATTEITSDPGLKPEKSDAVELSGEWFVGESVFRASLFHDRVQDAILRQLDILASLNSNTNVQRINNVDEQRTTGIEFAWSVPNLAGVAGLSLDGSMAFTRSKVEENALNPASEGKYWLRVPKTRGNLLLGYEVTPQWRGSLGYRHEGRAYALEDNSDSNIDVFGAVSKVNQLDARVTYSPNKRFDVSLGVDNLTDDEAFQFHPYPQRTFFLELKARL